MCYVFCEKSKKNNNLKNKTLVKTLFIPPGVTRFLTVELSWVELLSLVVTCNSVELDAFRFPFPPLHRSPLISSIFFWNTSRVNGVYQYAAAVNATRGRSNSWTANVSNNNNKKEKPKQNNKTCLLISQLPLTHRFTCLHIYFVSLYCSPVTVSGWEVVFRGGSL